MALRFEYTQRINYADIINRQLDRIAQIRTYVLKYMSQDVPSPLTPYLALAREYISAIETLYVVLLPELRGESDKYIILAKKFYSKLMEEEKIENKGIPIDDGNPLDEETQKRHYELQEEIAEILSFLPEKFLKFTQGYKDFPGLFVFYFLDAALEEMLVRLNQAGLLIQGRTVSVGVPHVPSGTHQKSIQV